MIDYIDRCRERNREKREIDILINGIKRIEEKVGLYIEMERFEKLKLKLKIKGGECDVREEKCQQSRNSFFFIFIFISIFIHW